MKPFRFFFLLSILSVILSGCWSSKELSDAAFLAGEVFEKENEKYKVTYQVLQPIQIKNEKPNASVLISSSGPTIHQATRSLIKGLKRRLYLAHTRVVVVSPEIAKEDIFKVLDMDYREQQFRLNSYLYIAEKPTTLLGQDAPLDPMTSFGLSMGTETARQDISQMPAVTMKDFLEMVNGPTKCAYAGTLLMHKEKPPAQTHVDLNGASIFKEGKLVKTISSPSKTRGILWFRNEVNDTSMSIKVNKNDYAAIEIHQANTEMIPRFKNDKLTININVKTKGDLNEWQSKQTLDLNIWKKIEGLTSKKIKKEMEDVFKVMKKQPVTDVLNINREIHRQLPDYWNQIKDHWEDEYIKLDLNIQVETNLKNMGLIKNRADNEKKEPKSMKHIIPWIK